MRQTISDIHPHDIDSTYSYGSATERVRLPFDLAVDGMATVYAGSSALSKYWTANGEEKHSLSADERDWMFLDINVKPEDIVKLGARQDVMDVENMGETYRMPELRTARVKMRFSDIVDHVEDGRFAMEQKQQFGEAQRKEARSQERAEFRERVMTDLVDSSGYEAANAFEIQ